MIDNKENIEIVDQMIAEGMKRIAYYNTLEQWPILNIAPEKSIEDEKTSIANLEDIRRRLVQEKWSTM